MGKLRAAMLRCTRTAGIRQCELRILCFGDLLNGRLFNIELYETVMFIHLFNGADSAV
jgi:hypothetical protein